MKRGKKSRKRKRGPAARARIHEIERRQHRLVELEEETRGCFESILERYSLSEQEQADLAWEWKLGLNVIATYENATVDDYRELTTCTYDSKPLSKYIDEEATEAFWRASFDLANGLGLAMVTIDEVGNISGEVIEY